MPSYHGGHYVGGHPMHYHTNQQYYDPDGGQYGRQNQDRYGEGNQEHYEDRGEERNVVRSRHIAGSGTTPTSGWVCVKDNSRKVDRKYHKSEYEVGMVVSMVHHTTTNNTKFGGETAYTDYGPVNSKYRKFVIIALYKEHYVALPVFTHNNQGLKGKNVEEFIAIREFGDEFPGPAGTPHGYIFARRNEEFAWRGEDGFFAMNSQTNCHVVQPTVHRYDTKCAISGAISRASIHRLLILFAQLFDATISTILEAVELPTPNDPWAMFSEGDYEDDDNPEALTPTARLRTSSHSPTSDVPMSNMTPLSAAFSFKTATTRPFRPTTMGNYRITKRPRTAPAVRIGPVPNERHLRSTRATTMTPRKLVSRTRRNSSPVRGNE